MLGHAVAKRTRLSWAAVAVLLIPALKECMIMKLDFSLGIIMLYILSFLNSKYEMKGKAILWLGAISYFFYLAHIRIGYTLLTYLGINSIILWVAITVMVSYLLYKLNSKITII